MCPSMYSYSNNQWECYPENCACLDRSISISEVVQIGSLKVTTVHAHAHACVAAWFNIHVSILTKHVYIILYILNLQQNQSTAYFKNMIQPHHALLVILSSLNIVFLSISATCFFQEHL